MTTPIPRIDGTALIARAAFPRLPDRHSFLRAMIRVDGRLVFAIGGGAPQREPILASVPTLDAIADDPLKAADLPPATARTLYARTMIVMSALLPLILAPTVADHSITAQPADDRLLTPDEAAAILGVSKVWLYRHAPRLTFARRLSRKTLRFSESGLRKYQAATRP